MRDKKELSPVEQYKRSQKIAKILRVSSPFVFWGLLALAVLCVILAFKNSVGNIVEIMDLLDNSKYTGEQLTANYQYLIGKWGEMTVGNGGNGFSIVFVNIGKALFSGMAIASSVFAVIFAVSAFILGKWLLPLISVQITEGNQDKVNIKMLESKE